MNWLEKALDTFIHGSISEPAAAVIQPVIALDKIQAAQLAYHEASTTATEEELAVLSAAIRKAQKEVNDAFTAGAKPCRKCGNQPHGMRRGNGQVEIGCLHCANHKVFGDTRTDAIQLWNSLN